MRRISCFFLFLSRGRYGARIHDTLSLRGNTKRRTLVINYRRKLALLYSATRDVSGYGSRVNISIARFPSVRTFARQNKGLSVVLVLMRALRLFRVLAASILDRLCSPSAKCGMQLNAPRVSANALEVARPTRASLRLIHILGNNCNIDKDAPRDPSSDIVRETGRRTENIQTSWDIRIADLHRIELSLARVNTNIVLQHPPVLTS